MAGLNLRGDTSGSVEIVSPAVAGDNTITLPNDNGSANQFFKNSTTAGIVTHSSMVEDASGNIGIGTTVPTETLHVVGDARVTGILTVGTASLTLNGTDGTITGINTINGLTYPSAGALSNRNKIINGEMRVAQHGTTAFPIGDDDYPTDRFLFSNAGTTDGGGTGIQTATSPNGFSNALRVDVTSADTSLDASAQYKIEYRVEGLDSADLNWGTANAQTVTLSFYIRSNKTGNTSVAIVNNGNNRSYVKTFTIDSADTWERKECTIPGDTSGTWLTSNSIGLRIRWGTYGSNFQTSSVNQWNASQNMSTDDSPINFFDTVANTLYLTGVQLEVGERATPFEHRSYGDDLARCQRYYYKLIADSGRTFANGYNQNTRYTRNILHFPVSMRIPPTALEQTGTPGNYRIYHGTTETACSGVPTLNSSTTNTAEIQADTGSGLSAGQGNALESNSNGTYLAFTAEL